MFSDGKRVTFPSRRRRGRKNRDMIHGCGPFLPITCGDSQSHSFQVISTVRRPAEGSPWKTWQLSCRGVERIWDPVGARGKDDVNHSGNGSLDVHHWSITYSLIKSKTTPSPRRIWY